MLTEIIFSPSSLAGVFSGLMEGSGLPWPGAAVLAAAGTGTLRPEALLLLAALFSLAYTFSALLQYTLARYSWPLVQRWLPPTLRHSVKISAARYSQWAVLYTRPLAVGNYISIPAGIAHMPVHRFLLFTFTGIYPWALGMLAAGGILGHYLTAVAEILPWAAAAAVVGTIIFYSRRFWLRRLRAGTTFGD